MVWGKSIYQEICDKELFKKYHFVLKVATGYDN